MLLNRLRSASFLKKPQRLRRKPNKIPEYLRQSIENCSPHMANQLLDKNGRISRRKTWVCLLRDQRIVTSAPWTVSAISCWYWFVSNHKRNVLSSPLNSGFGSGPEGKTSQITNKQFVVFVVPCNFLQTHFPRSPIFPLLFMREHATRSSNNLAV